MTTNQEPAATPLRIGVSACLLGEEVRFDGGHKRDLFVVQTLSRFVTFVPVCPEVEIGLGTPREAIRLVDRDGRLHLAGVKSGRDHTDSMLRYGERRTAELAKQGLSGYILKRDSPSCGMERVRVYSAKGLPARTGRGLFAASLLENLPLLPVEEEGRLQDSRLRENFIERVFAYRRLRYLLGGRWRVGDLVRFHTAEKMLILSHEPRAYQELGRLVAGAKAMPREEVAGSYQAVFMGALSRLATPARHTNVLQHMAGYLKKQLSPAEKRELAEVIGDFRAGLVPLVVPLTLLRHYVRLHQVAYLAGQTYLEPHPKELMLRNHV